MLRLRLLGAPSIVEVSSTSPACSALDLRREGEDWVAELILDI